jgi:hypothetical protein
MLRRPKHSKNEVVAPKEKEEIKKEKFRYMSSQFQHSVLLAA